VRDELSSAAQQKVKVPACRVRCLAVYGNIPDPARDVERRHCEHEQEVQAGGVRGRSVPHINCWQQSLRGHIWVDKLAGYWKGKCRHMRFGQP
jgi:hypothetical protein